MAKKQQFKLAVFSLVRIWLLRFLRVGTVSALLLGGASSQESQVWGLEGAIAQTTPSITSDNTTGTTVDSSAANLFSITGGSIRGNSLFHSFETFSPGAATTLFDLGSIDYADPTDSTMNLAEGINNIFSRVTGANRSFLNGDLWVNGGASPNFYLINPNGILIGDGASINVPGSVLLSTAESLLFDDGTAFAVGDSTQNPMLTVSAPIGLQFGDRANDIEVDGRFTSAFQPGSNNPAEFYNFQPNTNLTLLGGNLNLRNTYLNVPGGQINLGSVSANTQVGFDANSHSLSYSEDTIFSNITLDHAIAFSSFFGAGGINVDGADVQLINQSGLVAYSFGSLANLPPNAYDPIKNEYDVTAVSGKPINLNATGELSITDNSWISTDVVPITGPAAIGRGGDINITANTLTTGNRTYISATTYSDGDGGDLTITADDIVFAEGSVVISSVTSWQTGHTPIEATGQGGDLSIFTDRLTVKDVSQVGTGTRSIGDSGALRVEATDSISIEGSTLFEFAPGESSTFSSGIFISAERGSTGDGGELTIETSTLSITDGGKLGASTAGEGNAGNISITADDILIADPVIDGDGGVSGIIAAVLATSSGDAGTLTIDTDSLRLVRGGQITASTDGAGHAGDLTITADTIEVEGSSLFEPYDALLQSSISSRSSTPFDAGSVTITGGDRISIKDQGIISVSSENGGQAGELTLSAGLISLNNGSIAAEADDGNQANLTISSRDALVMRNGSQITTNATQNATGGDITLNSPVILGMENSDISANAQQGNGGGIRLITQGLIGIAFRDEPTLQTSDITATSETGLDGTVEIESPSVETDSGLVELPENLSDASNEVIAGCAADAGNQFSNSGRGGLPNNPLNSFSSNRPWQDTRRIDLDDSVSSETNRPAVDPDGFTMLNETVLAEASQWHINTAGNIELTEPSDVIANSNHNCLKQQVASML